jgi:peptidyl-prolyl cis-trans isomerase SurA
MKQITLLIFAAFLTVSSVSAQMAHSKVVADKIVGVVGDKIVLHSDVMNALLDARRHNQPVSEGDDCAYFAQILTLKALALQAEKDSLLIEDGELDAILDFRIRQFIQQYGSKEILEEIAGKTIYQIKEDMRQDIKEQELAKKMRSKIESSVKITPQEVKVYYDKIPKDSLNFYEAQLEIGQIVLYPKAHRDLELMAIEELNEFKKDVESGKQRFETLARLHTDDPGSKESGGRYNINRTEKNFDPAFVSHAFRLREGQISPVFKSKFGYHIILMEARAGDDATVRHILRIPRITPSEINEAKQRLDSVRSLIMAGTISFGDAVQRYSDDDLSKFTGGMISEPGKPTYLNYDELDRTIIQVLDKEKLQPGQYSQPHEYTDPYSGKQAVRILFLKTRSVPHLENLKDDYDKVAIRALEQKKQEYILKWFNSKIPTFYLNIDPSFQKCEMLSIWFENAKNIQK